MLRQLLKPRVFVFMVATVCGGCCSTHLHHIPDDFVDLINQCELGRAVRNLCCDHPCACCPSNGPPEEVCCPQPVACDCGVEICEEGIFQGCAHAPCRHGRKCCVEPGPPPICHKPEMPPKFLPVPTRSVFSPANPRSPVSFRGAVEAPFGPELVFPGRE